MKNQAMKMRIYRLFFPARCKYCGRVIRPSELLCSQCVEQLPKIEKPLCFKCGNSKSDCRCKGKSMFFDRIAAPYYFSGAIKKAVYRMKFGEVKHLCFDYGNDMAECVKENFSDTQYDLVCYVPFSSKQNRKRAFNQSEFLAKRISENLSVEFSDALVKTFDNNVQHKLRPHFRFGNVLGIYDVREGAELEGKRILLTDDIKTTGATLNECAKMLKIHGAVSVDCITFALVSSKTKD